MDRALAERVRLLYEAAWSSGTSWDESMTRGAQLLRDRLRDDPEDVEALTCLGAILSDTGEHREAAAVLRQARSLGSTDSNTYYNLGAALMNLGASGRRSARSCFARAGTLEPAPTTLRAYFDPHGH